MCIGHKYFVSLCQFFNLMLCSVFPVKLKCIIIIATSDGPIYLKKIYDVYIFVLFNVYIFYFHTGECYVLSSL